LLTVDKDGKPSVQKELVLDSREMDIELDISKPFKLNAGTVTPGQSTVGSNAGCPHCDIVRVLYSPERLIKIAAEAAEGEGVFSIDDRIGLVSDAAALAGAGFAKTSAVLQMVHELRNEPHRERPRRVSTQAQCFLELVWTAFADLLNSIRSTWFEHKAVVNGIRRFARVSSAVLGERRPVAHHEQFLHAPLVEKLGYDFPVGEDSNKALLRKRAIMGAVFGGDAQCVVQLPNLAGAKHRHEGWSRSLQAASGTS
jgi:aminopeptidase 2